MRYQDWDILLYPKDCEVPFKEFKTTCYAVQEDGSGAATSGNGTPTLACLCQRPHMGLTDTCA